MDEVYRVISRDYKHNYDYFTKDKELFDLFANSDGLDDPGLNEEVATRYELDINDGAWEAFWAENCPAPKFPYIILGETTQYTT